jgi:hypothetical protein
MNLTKTDRGFVTANAKRILDVGDPRSAVWLAAKELATLMEASETLTKNPRLTGSDLGHYFAEKYNLNWTRASEQRNGNGIRIWTVWLLRGAAGNIPSPPGRLRKNDTPAFDFVNH